MRKNMPTKPVVALLAILVGTWWAGPVVAEYAKYGQGMQPVLEKSGILNGAVYLHTKTTWMNSGTFAEPAGGNGVSKPYTLNTDFDLTACDSFVEARLLLTAWGGTADYACDISVEVNGNSVVAGMAVGSTGDGNPTFSGTEACVYGSGYGVWLVGIPIPAAFLNTDGSGNAVSIGIEDDTQLFDGRIQQVTLLAVYQDSGLNNILDYVVAEGSGDIYRTEDLSQTPPKVESRTIGLGAVDTSNVVAAHLNAMYTYGTDEQNDRLFFNGTQLGNDDVADFDADSSPYDYGPDLVSFDVTSRLEATNDLLFTVSDVHGVPGLREYSLRPQLAVLEITHAPIPEPSTIVMVMIALGSGALAARGRRGSRR